MLRRIGVRCLQIGIGAAAAFFVWALSVPLPAIADPGTPTAWPTPCNDHPCSGYAYELVYRVSHGRITGVSSYDPCGPPYFDCAATRPIVTLTVGEDWMNIASNPDVADIMFHFPDYKVDLDTLEIVRRAPQAATEAAEDEPAASLGSDSGEPPTWLPAVTGAAIAGAITMAAALCARIKAKSRGRASHAKGRNTGPNPGAIAPSPFPPPPATLVMP